MKKLAALVLALLVLVSGTVYAEDTPAPAIRDTISADGFRHVDMPVDVSGDCSANILLDASHLSVEDLLYAKLLANLVPYIHTTSHTREELDALSGEYLLNPVVRLSFLKEGTDGIHIYLRMHWYSQEKNLSRGYDLMYEMFFEADLDDAESILAAAGAVKENLHDTISSSPYQVQIYRAAAVSNLLNRAYNYVTYLDYYAFLEQAETQLADNPEAFLAQMKRVRGLLADSRGAVAAFAGNENSIALNGRLADAFLSRLGTESHEPADYSSLPVPAAREGLVIDSNDLYNLIFVGFGTLDIQYSADLDALAELVTDKYLRPGMETAYYVIHVFTDSLGMYIVSYRDSEIRSSFEAMEQAGSFVAGLDMGQEELDGYISSAAGYYSPVSAENSLDAVSNAVSDIIDYLEGVDPLWRQQGMKSLEAMTPETVRAYAPLYTVLAEKGVRSTAGGAEILEQNADLYDVILNPFHIFPGVFQDVPEDHPRYNAVRFVTDKQIMPAPDGVFGVDLPATEGDLAVALTALVFGEAYSLETSLQFLAEYDIMKADTDPGAALTAGTAADRLNALASLAGLKPQYAVADADAVLTRGEFAEILMNWNDWIAN